MSLIFGSSETNWQSLRRAQLGQIINETTASYKKAANNLNVYFWSNLSIFR
jgi:hypothetical protein